jgi:hypothetical protein
VSEPKVIRKKTKRKTNPPTPTPTPNARLKERNIYKSKTIFLMNIAI